MLGSQQVETHPGAEVDGVFAMWYGKGPGVDRAGDALKHGNAYGSSPRGGVLVVAGDDHGCVSSSMPHQSDVAFMAWFMPTLNPASVAEYLSFGEYGYALSRFSGMWVGFKAISETVESAQSVELPPDRRFVLPDFAMPPGGLHYRWPDLPGPQIEERMEAKKHAVWAFADGQPDRPRDLRHPRRPLRLRHHRQGPSRPDGGAAAARARRGAPAAGSASTSTRSAWSGRWPGAAALDFVRDKEEVLVVEEKRGIIESQLKEYFYDYPGHKPERMVGKRDEDGRAADPLDRRALAAAAGAAGGAAARPHLPRRGASRAAPRRWPSGRRSCCSVAGATRTPYFCSGCPHNTSTKVPEGSQALAGIGCHFMASWMDRETSSLIQMGGEGVNWAASSRFTGRGHVFQNLGEGTWYHSGSMAIRQAIAAGANITYKILYNDAVAMTGGQPVDGPISVQAIAHIARAEGVERIALVSDDAGEVRPAPTCRAASTIHHRRELDAGAARAARDPRRHRC